MSFRALHRPGDPFILANAWDVGSARMLAGMGAQAGICIEDTALPVQTPYDRALAIDRIRAGAAAARALPHDFMLTARADGIMIGAYDCDEAIARLQGFEAAGADCLYAPLPASTDDLARICASVSAPVNALVAGPIYTGLSRAEFAALGVARLSLGSALARATHRVIHNAAGAMFGTGDFAPLGSAMSGDVVDELLKQFT